ncbi:MAG: hypothetical protein IPM40_13580 [Gammaproteobacteria bacterium]|nr:hypothetical protein [Gammaproteobacteria bacterium]
MFNKLKVDRAIEALPWRIAKVLQQKFPPLYAYFHVINEDPLMIMMPEDFPDDRQLWSHFFEALRNVDVTILCLIRGPLEAGGGVGLTILPRPSSSTAPSFPATNW